MGGGGIPILRRKSDYECPECGNVPNANDDGTPEAFIAERNGHKAYHCIPCAQAWQQAMTALLPFQVPRLVQRSAA